MKTTFLQIAVGQYSENKAKSRFEAAYESSADAPTWPNDPAAFCNTRVMRDYEWRRLVDDTKLAYALYADNTLGNRNWQGTLALNVYPHNSPATRLLLLKDVTVDYTHLHSGIQGRPQFAAGWRPYTFADGVTRFSTRDPEISEALAVLQWLSWWAQYSTRLSQGQSQTVISIWER